MQAFGACISHNESMTPASGPPKDENLTPQVGDGGDSGAAWVTVDENGHIIQKDHNDTKDGGQDGDLSPPRRRDLSPPRKRARAGSEDQSPPRRGHDGRKARTQSGDQSPPRRSAGGGKDQNSLRSMRGRVDSEDQSPLRRTGNARVEQSHPRSRVGGGRQRHDSDSDQSPPRKKSEQSLPGKGHAAGEEGDQSPPRRRGAGSDREYLHYMCVVHLSSCITCFQTVHGVQRERCLDEQHIIWA